MPNIPSISCVAGGDADGVLASREFSGDLLVLTPEGCGSASPPLLTDPWSPNELTERGWGSEQGELRVVAVERG